MNPDRRSNTSATTRPSSGRLANNGNPATFWQADAGDTNAWLSVDLERVIAVSQVKLTFPADGNWRYRVEISDDDTSSWRMVADQSQSASRAHTATLRAENGARGRFLRVQFIGVRDVQSAAIAEVEAQGHLVTQ